MFSASRSARQHCALPQKEWLMSRMLTCDEKLTVVAEPVEGTLSALRLLSINQIRALTGLGRTFVSGQIKAELLPARKCGSRTLVRVEDFAAWRNSLVQISARTKASNKNSHCSNGNVCDVFLTVNGKGGRRPEYEPE